MKRLTLFLPMAVMLFAPPARADQIRQTCRTIAVTEAPAPLRGAIQKLKPAAIRLCKQIDFNTESYSALGQIVPLSGGVCHYFETTLPRGPNNQTEYMARAGAQCPSQTSGNYVAVDLVSASDFVAITDLLRRIESSPDASNTVFSAISNSRLRSPEFVSFERFVRQNKSASAWRISRRPGFLNLYSTFDVMVGKPDDPSGFYVLKMRKFLWGQVEIVDVERAMS